MKLVFLLAQVEEERGSFHSAVRTATVLDHRHDVEVWVVRDVGQVARWAEATGLSIRALTSIENGKAVAADAGQPTDEPDLSSAPSRLVPKGWEGSFSALSDRVLQAALSELEADVVVTTSAGTLAAAVSWSRPGTAIVHDERFRPGERKHALEALRVFGPRLRAVTVGDEVTAAHLRRTLGATSPPVVCVPPPLPNGFLPRSRGTSRLVVAVGSPTRDQQLEKLVTAFGEVADQLPGWRLRIFGSASLNSFVAGAARKALVFDRVELPGGSADMPSEWARAAVAVVTNGGGLPLACAEAMAAGLPVVAYNHADGCAQLIEHEQNGLLVNLGSPDELSAALLRLGRDPALRSELGDAAHVSIHHLEPEVVARQWEVVLDDAQRGGPTTAAAPVGPDGPAPDETAPISTQDVTPGEAREQTLRLLARIAQAVSDEWFVLRPIRVRAPVVVVPASSRRAFLTRLAAEDDLSLQVVENTTSEPTAPYGSLRGITDALVRTQPSMVRLSVPREAAGRATLAAHGGHIDVEFWAVVDDTLVPPRGNEWVRLWRRGANLADADVAGVRVRTIPGAVEPTVHDREFAIDAVYTWVDGDDPDWQAERDATLQETSGLALSQAASGRARFVSRDELRYSMRSLHLFAPWLRHIYVVTNGQVPEWLDISHPDVTLVRHDEILPAEHLPTFNSHAIETALHRIPTLSDHFIYFNDDVLLGRPLLPDHFFSTAGEFAVFSGTQILGDEHDPRLLPSRRAGQNNRELLKRDFGQVITRMMRHTPHPFTRQVLADVESRYREDVLHTSATTFRSENDISMVSSLGQHYGLLTGAAYLGQLDTTYVAITHANLKWVLSGLLATRDSPVICVADHHDWALPEARANALVREFFDAYYPRAAPWERPDVDA